MKVADDVRSVISASGEVYRANKKLQEERFLSNETLKNSIERVVTFRNRARARSSSKRRAKIRIAALASVRNTLEKADQMNATNIRTVFNVSLYLLLLDQDLAYFTDDLVQAIGDRRRAFIAKQEAVLLFEAAEDVRQLLGKEFRAALINLNVERGIFDRLNSISTNLNRFWDQHREFLKTTRNVLAAHRDHDALRYVRYLENLEPLSVMRCAVEFSSHVDLLAQELIKISQLTADSGLILRDILSSSARGEV